MVLTAGDKAPYAPTPQVVSIIERHRRIGMPLVSVSKLKDVGVPASLAPRTMQSLVGLGFYDEDGKVTREFDALRDARSDEWQPRLAALLRNVYSEVVAFAPPEDATTQQIDDAFVPFEPKGQRARMVQLYVGLFTYAGVRQGETPQRRTTTANRPATKVTPKKAPAKSAKPKMENNQNDQIPPPPPPPPPNYGDNSRTVTLANGGTVIVAVNFNPLTLRGPDRKFYGDLLDLLDGYEGDTGSPATPGNDKASTREVTAS